MKPVSKDPAAFSELEASVEMPSALLEKIGTAEHATVYPCLLYLLLKDQRHPGASVKISDWVMMKYGVDADRKMLALHELRELGIIRFTQVGTFSPIVRLVQD
jgi:hypothetical protein